MSLIYDEDYVHFDLECDCSHAILQLVVDKIEEEGYWTLYEMAFSTYQRPFSENLKTNLKMIWSILRGRRFSLYSVLIPKERMEEFKKFVADI